MSRIVLAVLGALLALYVVFGLVLPALFGLLKFVIVLAVVAFVVVALVTVVSKSKR
ncbi:hypothetical protein OG884_16940 [Streptosporangium sp. NBC_01755]|uniref:hypothetical protein n=1 Tax=unclassified Streptosporangium TaxID=2632669 RepID=UPI002DDB72DA|nr:MULTISPECIES: hypothetical protein [unclassified Streptosporangium]WSA25155.1 hypothetical protein OIE13_30175 [Streptosporangium sp. NBC_01810]WSD03504.1 hypothetical protein OG884_16940 [Streptosporangium sp. NBC_01755]